MTHSNSHNDSRTHRNDSYYRDENQHDESQAYESEAEMMEVVEANRNPDPITGEAGAHPVGTGVGAAAAGAAGAAIGATAGPIGAVVGAVVGSVIGGLVGKSAAEAVNPTVEEGYWREHYRSRPYVRDDYSYEDYHPAYRTGYEGYTRYAGRPYKEVEPELRHAYEAQYPSSSLTWDDAQYATRDAWDRAERNALFYEQDEYWRKHYRSLPYYEQNLSYEDYQPAFRTGYEGYAHYFSTGRSYAELEPELRREYENRYAGTGELSWERAKYAVRDAWHRAEQMFRANQS